MKKMDLMHTMIEIIYNLWIIYQMLMDTLISIHPLFYIWDKIDMICAIVGVFTIIVNIFSKEKHLY
jgi:hypothetical protein